MRFGPAWKATLLLTLCSLATLQMLVALLLPNHWGSGLFLSAVGGDDLPLVRRWKLNDRAYASVADANLTAHYLTPPQRTERFDLLVTSSYARAVYQLWPKRLYVASPQTVVVWPDELLAALPPTDPAWLALHRVACSVNIVVEPEHAHVTLEPRR